MTLTSRRSGPAGHPAPGTRGRGRFPHVQSIRSPAASVSHVACSLDLGATAKALAADRAAEPSPGTWVKACWLAWAATSPPPARLRPEAGPWASPVSPRPGRPGRPGGCHRTGRSGQLGHLGPFLALRGPHGAPHRRPAYRGLRDPYWVLVSATGASCVEANMATTAGVVWGAEALERLAHLGQAVRLVRTDGRSSRSTGGPRRNRHEFHALWYATRATGLVALVLLTATWCSASRRPPGWPATGPALPSKNCTGASP